MPKGVGYGGGSMRGMQSGGKSMKMGMSGGMMMDSRGNGMASNSNVKTTPGQIMPNRKM